MRKLFKVSAATLLFCLVAAPAFAGSISKVTVSNTAYQLGKGVRFSGYVTPKFDSGNAAVHNRKVEFVINEKYNDANSYNTDVFWKFNSQDNPYVNTTTTGAKFYNKDSVKGKTFFKGVWVSETTGKFRVRARVTWTDADLVDHEWVSPWTTFSVRTDIGAPEYVSTPKGDKAFKTTDDVKFTAYVKFKYWTPWGKKMVYHVERKDADNFYEAYGRFNGVASWARADFKYRTPTKVNCGELPAGSYRVKARFTWTDALGKKHNKTSKFFYFKVKAVN